MKAAVAFVASLCAAVQAQYTTTTATTTTIASGATTTTTASYAGQTHYGQCGGLGFAGPTVCAPPYVCTYSNPWFSHCL
ncbi:hypothetical protein M407DRAFT_21610 [Tulasnella calospora MUT 4182]|uniref:CBM1 domain-containing protein n=1 Tax=Tulasnella calospora MUT 4182 TaxID=1051891 RepID=A0A0C3L5U9_9AGAM|nr:hypothetical protein M407DRAFT_21610 [Tulasnella calospora MUT 4182]